MLEFLLILNSVSFWLKYYYIFTTFLCDNYRKFCYQGPKETILFVTIALALPRKVQLEKLLEQRKLLKSFLAKFSPYPKLFFVHLFVKGAISFNIWPSKFKVKEEKMNAFYRNLWCCSILAKFWFILFLSKSFSINFINKKTF